MADLRIMTNSGAEAVVHASTVQAFQASVQGAIIRSGCADYESARKTWNGMIDKYPALITRCTGVADVIAAVRFARDHDLLVAVRGGGHSLPGFSVCDDGMVIDLSQMKAIRVDPVKRTAAAQAGLTWGDYDRETQVFGLASTGGVIATTGIAGLTLGGGHRLAHAQVRPGLRSSAFRRSGHRRWPVPDRQHHGESRPVLGHARRRRQFWHRHFL